MAGLHSNRTPQVGPWPAGINNVAAESSLPRNEFGTRPIAVREAVNVDLTKDGHMSRRQGYTPHYAGTLVHSLWSEDALDFGLFVDGGVLHTLDQSGGVESLGLDVGDLPLSYSLVGDRVLFSNGSTSGMLLLPGRVLHPWAVAVPDLPAIDVVPGYGLPAGTYQIAFTVVDALGRESGASHTLQLELPEGSGLLVSPGAPLAPGHRLNAYLSAPNDDVLRFNETLAGGGLIASQHEGPMLATQLLTAMPPGQFTCVLNGVHWVADGRTLRWSPPFRYGMTDPGHNLVRFDARIDLLAPVDGGKQGAGMFVAAGKRTYWLGGAVAADRTFVDAHSAGAVPGTLMQIKGQLIGMDDDSEYSVWLSRRGTYVIGMPGGDIAALKSGEAAIDDADRGASTLVERNGMHQMVTALRGPRAQGLAISDRAVARVVHTDR